MEQKQNRWKLGSLMALLLFVIFAVCVLAVLLAGADVYKRNVERNRKSYDERTAVSFLTTKVRQGDLMDALEIRQVQDRDVLVWKEEIDGSSYETWIYCYDGFIRELFAAAGSGLPLEAGSPILEAESLRFWWQDGEPSAFLEIEITTAGGSTQLLTLKLRSGEEVGS